MPNKTSSKNLVARDKDYKSLLAELKSIIAKGQYQAYKAVDNIRVQAYWQIGERIVREELNHKYRAGYGEYLVDNLTGDLGIARRDLYRIVKFYRVYEIVGSVSPQLSWTHYRYLIEIENENERAFYQHNTILHSWSVRKLQKQIKNKLFENTPQKDIQAVFQTQLPAVEPQQVFKETYDFQFIELRSDPDEKELQDKILANLITFLKELGEDFCIRGSQVPIKIDRETHHIDLVLYHCGIAYPVMSWLT
jgi:predicted nuclease of restriction endonuclease-like (RecB) superfamily